MALRIPGSSFFYQKNLNLDSRFKFFLPKKLEPGIDFVCAFSSKYEAQRFYQELGKRLAMFNLQLAEDKTHIVKFSRYQKKDKSHFDFLGFEFRWGKSRFGKVVLKRRTSPKKLKKAIMNFTKWCRNNCHQRVSILLKQVNSKLRGYYNYYGLAGNSIRGKSFCAQKLLPRMHWVASSIGRKSIY
jgi:hypothetical protein